MKNLTVFAAAFMICTTSLALAKSTGNRAPAGDGLWEYIEGKVSDGYHYWLEGVHLGNDEAKAAFAKMKKDIADYFDVAGPFKAFVAESQKKAVDAFNEHVEITKDFWTKGKGGQFIQDFTDTERNYYTTGEGGKFLKDRYKITADFWTKGMGKRFLDQQTEDARYFWTDGPGGKYVKEKKQITEEFWTAGPGSEWSKKRAQEAIDFYYRAVKDLEEKKLNAAK